MREEFLYQNKIFKDRRKELRNDSTEFERLLWDKLKGSRLNGLKFTRQYSVGPYILDFYCPKLRLGIELDGNQHREKDAVLYDKDRTDYLEAANINIIRFWNEEITTNILKVLEKIQCEITRIGPTPA